MPRRWHQVCGNIRETTVARKPGHRGERVISCKPLRREGRIASAEPVCSCAFSCCLLHARPRVQRAPGLPCALFRWRAEVQANLGHIVPRECGVMFWLVEIGSSPRHCEPTGRATARPMTGSAKQSRPFTRDCFVALALRNDGGDISPSHELHEIGHA